MKQPFYRISPTMKSIIVTLCLIGCLAEATYTPSICKVKGYRDKSPKLDAIYTDNGSFPIFLKSSYVFVDKSALIEYIIEPTGNKRHMITLPRRWGKSLNLDMLRFFLEAEVSENGTIKPSNETDAYKFFVEGKINQGDGTYKQLEQPPEISKKHEIIRKHLAKYSVVKFDLAGLKSCVSSEQGFLECFKPKMVELHEHFSYVESFIEKSNETDSEDRNTDLDAFRKNLNSSYPPNRVDMMESVRYLCRSIYLYFNKKIIILIDEYDGPYNSLFINENHVSNETADDIIRFTINFLRETVKLSWYFNKAVLTGVDQIIDDDLFDEWINTQNISLMNHGKTDPYYGFTQPEVDMLLAATDLSNRAVEVKQWYKGYHCLENPSILYSPWSISNYINLRVPTKLWSKTALTRTIMKVFENNLDLKLELLNLVNNNTYVAVPMNKIRIGVDELQIMEQFFKKSPTRDLKVTNDAKDLFFGFLSTYGYLTPSPQQDITDKIKLTVPNIEVQDEITDDLDRFASNLIGNDFFEQCDKVATSIESFLYNNRTESDVLKGNIKAAYSNKSLLERAKHPFDKWTSEDLHKIGANNKNEAAMHHVMISLLSLQKSRSLRSLPLAIQYCVRKNNTKKDLFFYTSKRAMIIELRSDAKVAMDETFDQVVQSSSFFQEKNLPFEAVKYLGVSISDSSNIEVLTTMKWKEKLNLNSHN